MFEPRNIRVRYLKITERIRNFLLSKQSREFLIFLFFVFVSFCFWVLQMLNYDYETEFAMPVRLKNVPSDVVLTSELPHELRIGVKDRGTVLANYLVGQTFFPVVLDFKDYEDKGQRVRIPVADLAKEISAQLNQTTKVLTVKPDTLEFIYTKGKAKKLPVRLQGQLSPDRQYYVSDILYSPDSVMVYAPQEILDTLTAAYTVPLDVENVSDTLRRRVNLASVKGAKFIPTYNDVTVLVDIYAEKTLEVPIRGVNFPADQVLRTFPSKAQVTFQVGLSHFKQISPDDFLISVDYRLLLDNKTDKCMLDLQSFSPYVNHVRLSPKSVDYLIEQQVRYND